MSKTLKEEYEKFTEFIDELHTLNGGNHELAKQTAREQGKAIIEEYNRRLSLQTLLNFRPEEEVDTPEEVETLAMCLAVASM